MTKKFVPLYFIFRLFYLEFKKDYPKDYFDELARVISDVVKRSNNISFDEDLLSISCHFLYSSNKRFKFSQNFIRYANNFVDNF